MGVARNRSGVTRAYAQPTLEQHRCELSPSTYECITFSAGTVQDPLSGVRRCGGLTVCTDLHTTLNRKT